MPECDAPAGMRLKLAHYSFLEGKAVVELEGTEFPRGDRPIAERVAEWFEANGHREIRVEGIGLVPLNKRAVHNSLGHGYSRRKVVAFVAVPSVLRFGQIIYQEPLRDLPKGTAYHVAAPISIAGQSYVLSALIKSDANGSRMYVHEVVPKEKLRESANKHSDSAQRAVDRSTTEAGAIHRVLYGIYSVKGQGD